MKDKPILFKDDMVKASDEGRKTQTRRLDGLAEINKNPDEYIIKQAAPGDKEFPVYMKEKYGQEFFIKPKYQPGDHLWIKQNFQITGDSQSDHLIWGKREDGSKFDVKLTDREWAKFSKWKKSFQKKSKLFMFKSLAYKWLEVTNVRAERLQDITTEDILKEGIKEPTQDRILYNETMLQYWSDLWNSINEKRGYPWESNPYVWVIEFKKIDAEKKLV